MSSRIFNKPIPSFISVEKIDGNRAQGVGKSVLNIYFNFLQCRD